MSQSSLYVAIALLAMVASWYLVPRQWMRLLSFLARLITGLRSRKVEVDGVTWHYLEGGKGPTLVILHGLSAEADHFLGIAGPLHRQFHVLVPELPGFGDSQKPEGLGFRIGDQARRLDAWLDRMGVDECIMAGNSMGAWVAADFAAHNPERVQALWLMDPLGVVEGEENDGATVSFEGDRNPFLVRNMREYAQLIGSLFYKPPQVPYPIARAGYLYLAGMQKDLPRIFDEFLGDSTPMDELATQLTMPVLIEWGEDDQVANPDGARVLQERIPGSTRVVHPEVGHLPMLEAPTLAVQVFQHFAQEHGLIPMPPLSAITPVGQAEESG